MLLDDSTQLSTATFSSIVGQMPGNDVIVRSFLVDSFLYVVNATQNQLFRFCDTDNNGSPDSLDPATGIAMGQSANSILPLVDRIYFESDGSHIVTEGRNEEVTTRIIVDSNALTLDYVFPAIDSTPAFYGHKPVAEMNRVRLSYTSETIQLAWLESNGVRISEAGAINPDTPWTEVAIATPLEAGTNVRVVTGDGKASDDILVLPRQPVIFAKDPFTFSIANRNAVFEGCCLGETTYSIHDGENEPSMAQINIIDDRQLVVDISLLLPGMYWIWITDSSGNHSIGRMFRTIP